MAEVCGAQCPSEYGVICARPPGTNAFNEQRWENVHVHWFRRDDDGAVFRWEDAE